MPVMAVTADVLLLHLSLQLASEGFFDAFTDRPSIGLLPARSGRHHRHWRKGVGLGPTSERAGKYVQLSAISFIFFAHISRISFRQDRHTALCTRSTRQC